MAQNSISLLIIFLVLALGGPLGAAGLPRAHSSGGFQPEGQLSHVWQLVPAEHRAASVLNASHAPVS